jgi:hypothetical protein
LSAASVANELFVILVTGIVVGKLLVSFDCDD